MAQLNRRHLLAGVGMGLASAGATGLMLRSDAAPTTATDDAHGYEEFLDKNGIPQIEPAERWAPSHEDILGPFYLPGAPFRGKVTPPLEPGDLLVMHGRVWGYDSKKPLSHAILDVWQADAKGRYDLDDPRNPPPQSEFKNRIRLITDETGHYEFETIRPAAYRIGRGRSDFRPSHIHYMIQADGYKKLITQLYFKGDPYLERDPWAQKSDLIIETEKIKVPEVGSYDQGRFDIVLEPA